MLTVSSAQRLLMAFTLFTLTLVAAPSLLAQDLSTSASDHALVGPGSSGLDSPGLSSPGLGSPALATPDFLPVEEAYVLAVEQLDGSSISVAQRWRS